MRRPVSPWQAVGVAAVATLFATIVRLPLEPWLGERVPFLTFFVAVWAAAWFGGRLGGASALVLGGASAAYFVLEPRGSFAIATLEYQVALALYAPAAGTAVLIVERLRAAQRRAETAEAKLRESEERHRVTLGSIGDAVIATDVEGRVTFINEVAARLTGWTIEDAIGLPLGEVFDIVHEHTRAKCENPVERVLREGVVVGLANHTALIAKGGAREHIIEDSAAPIRGSDGSLRGVVLVFRDSTEKSRLDRERTEASERLEIALEAGRMGVFEWNLKTDAIWWSPSLEPMHGLETGTFGGTLQALEALIHEDDRARVTATIERAVVDRTSYAAEFRTVAPDGSTRWVSAHGRLFLDDDGNPVRMVGLCADVTERKRVEGALVRSELALKEAARRKDDFLATLAHELRNPLAPIRTALELIRLTKGEPVRLERASAVMERQLLQMVRLIDDLLDVSRITRNKIELRKERVTLQDVIQSAVETSAPLFAELRHSLSVDLPREPIVLDADFTRLAQIFGNVLNNAGKYTEPGGRVKVSCTVQARSVEVRIADDGIGFTREQGASIFEMFAQVTPALERARGGLGIGLALARGFVEMHGGTISARSDGPGKGSEFRIELPLADGHVSPANPPTLAVAERSASLLRIVVADDNRDAADLLVTMAALRGHIARAAYDGREAVEASIAHAAHVVILDIGMPVMNGYEAAKAIRESPVTRGAVLIAMTGWGQEADKRAASTAGFDHHVTKPVDPTKVFELLEARASATLKS